MNSLNPLFYIATVQIEAIIVMVYKVIINFVSGRIVPPEHLFLSGNHTGEEKPR